MDLSGLESADTIDTKEIRAAPIKDCLGSFGMVSSPGCSRIVPVGKDALWLLCLPSTVLLAGYIVRYLSCVLSNILSRRQTRCAGSAYLLPKLG